MKNRIVFLLLFFIVFNLYGHHGVASLGVAGLHGPGAPVDTSTSATLPDGSFLTFFKSDRAEFKTWNQRRDDDKITNEFFMMGLGYGFTSYLSGYVILPYNVKKTQDSSFNSAGFSDVSLLTVIGLKYDHGFLLVPGNENLDELEDWHFTLYQGLTLPTGNPNLKNRNGEIDPSMSHGFGSHLYTLGATVTKQWSRFTFVQDVSYRTFDPYRYADDVRMRFGNEFRYNLAFVYRLYSSEETKFRFDPILELNYQVVAADHTKGITRREKLETAAAQLEIPLHSTTAVLPDRTTAPWRYEETFHANQSSVVSVAYPTLLAKESGMQLLPSGGRILYTLIGSRFYYKTISFAIGLKVPVFHSMNSLPGDRPFVMGHWNQEDMRDVWWNYVHMKESLYQGSEGLEKYRLLFTFSTLI